VDSRRLNLGVVRDLHAESFGEPGRRTFRVRAESGETVLSIWLEKEQIVMLGSALDELLERVQSHVGEEPSSDTHGAFIGDLELKAGSLAVGFDAGLSGFTLEASDFESDFDLEKVRLVTTRTVIQRLSEEIDGIVSAGRPRCPMCGRALAGGPHFCPESNGHAKVSGTN
jgi:uncharacterized repeat protein (TIGR03847 family)